MADTTPSAVVTERPGETPTAQAGTPGGQPGATPAPITWTPEQQAEINRIAAQARTEGRTQAQRDADQREQERQNQEAAAQGQFKTVAEAAQKELERVKAELAQERRQATIIRLAAAANLPANLHKFVVGADEAEIQASVTELAAAIKPPTAPRTGAGEGTRPQAAPGTPAAPASSITMEQFIPPGAVRW